VAGRERALKPYPGVTDGRGPNLAPRRAGHHFQRLGRSGRAAVRAIESAGYPPFAKETTELAIRTWTCASCVGRVEKGTRKNPGGLFEALQTWQTERALGTPRGAGSLSRRPRSSSRNRRLQGPPLSAEKTASARDQGQRAVGRASTGTATALSSLQPSSTLPVFISRDGLAPYFLPCIIGVMGVLGQRSIGMVQFALATPLVLLFFFSGGGFSGSLRFFHTGGNGVAARCTRHELRWSRWATRQLMAISIVADLLP